MRVCIKCKKQLEEGVTRCNECGTESSKKIQCPHCKKKVDADFEFCPFCGKKIKTNVSKKKRRNPMIIKIAGSAVVIIVVLVLLVSLIINGMGRANYLFYLKGEELCYLNVQNMKSEQITEDFNDLTEFDNQQLKNNVSQFSDYIQVNENKKTIFYVDQLEGMNCFSLYFRRVNSSKEPVKIAKNVSKYKISKEGNVVSYLKSDGSLYWYDLKERDKLANNVNTYYMSEDGKGFVYLTKTGEAYFQSVGEERQQIDSEITSINHISDDFKNVYYLKETGLYKKTLDKETVVIASDIKQVVSVFESGEVYYLKGDYFTIKLEDYVQDDMLEADLTMVKPETPLTPNQSDYATTEEYEVAYEKYKQLYTEYQQAMMNYSYKLERDKLRNGELAGRTIEVPQYELYYFDGKKEHLVAKDVAGYKECAKEKAAIVYSCYNYDTKTKLLFSEFKNSFGVENMVIEKLAANNYCIALKAKSSKINQSEATQFIISKNADKIFILTENTKNQTSVNRYDLYQIDITKGKTGKKIKIDSEVSRNITLLDNEHYVYYKQVDENSQNGDLFMDGKRVESDVRIDSLKYDEEKGNLWYIVDWEENEQHGTLKKYADKEITKVSDEVFCYEILPDGNVVFLQDYNIENGEGTLYYYKRNRSKKIVDDVIAIIPVKG